MSNTLPVVGAAMPSTALDAHLEWLLADQRDLEIQDFAAPYVLESDNLANHIAEIRSKLDGYRGRMGIHAPFWNLSLAAYDPKIRTVVQERLQQALDIAAQLGATHMVIHSPLAFLGHPRSISQPMIGSDILFEVVHATLQPVVQKAEQHACMLVIENIYDQYPTMLSELVQSFESDCVRQSLDTGHAYINYRLGAPPPDYFVQEAGSLLAHVHLQDTDGFTDRHWAIGEGRIDWHELFRAFAQLESQPRLILELHDYTKIPKSMAWLTEQGIAR